MKKLFLMAGALAALILTACNPDEPKADAVGTTYPRVMLIEHFTGADCGYCPAGMDYLYEEYSKNPDNFVWVSNHYGYGSDAYSIKASTTIGKALGVTGAPSISYNREKYTLGGTSSRVYHPGYIETIVNKPSKTATEVIEISREYDAATRLLTVTVTGKTSREDLAGVMLTVGVTESGMTGIQADFYETWEGWTKFVHTHTIRTFATEALGDEWLFEKRIFTAVYEIRMDSKWQADNCEIVAWITAAGTKYPVLNAAKMPVVEGTKGGEDIKHGGVEMKEIPATYPEKGTPVSDMMELTNASATYNSDPSYTLMKISLNQQTTPIATSGTTNLFPYVEVYLFLEAGTTTIPNGVYTFEEPTTLYHGCAIAGMRDDAEHKISWSELFYVYPSGGSLYIGFQWLLQTGAVTVTDEGISVEATTLNGSTVKAHYSGVVTPKRGSSSAPARVAASPICEEGAPQAILLAE